MAANARSRSKLPKSIAGFDDVQVTSRPAVAEEILARMPAKRVSASRVKYVHQGKGLPRSYHLDD